MKRATNLLLSAILLSSTILGGALPARAGEDDSPFPYCQLLEVPNAQAKQSSAPGAAPAAPAATPAAPAATPAAPAATPAAPAAPAATPAAPAATPAAPATAPDAKADADKPPAIGDLLKVTTDAGDIVNRILSKAAPSKPEDLEKMYNDVYDHVISLYIEPSRIEGLYVYKDKYKGKITSWSELDAAIADLVKAVNDRWTWYQNPVEILAHQIDKSEKLVDFGANLRLQPDGSFVVEFIDPGSTAQTDGIREGDTIVSVNDQALAGLTKDAAEKLLRKRNGDQLRIVSLQNGEKVEKIYTLQVPAEDANAANAEVVYGNIAYLKLPTFMSMELFEKLVDKLVEMQMKTPGGVQSIILDLRYNGGGRVDMAKALIQLLLDHGVILHEKSRHDLAVIDTTTSLIYMPKIMKKQRTPEELALLNAFHGLPLVVLINGSSASASEIVTGALQDARPNTTVIGERSFGKGVEMSIMDLPTCGKLAVTSAAYTTPSGKWLHNVGIEPNKVVHQERGSRDDSQFMYAVNFLRGQTARNGGTVAVEYPADTQILGKLPERPLEPKVNTWKQAFEAHRSDIARGAAGAFFMAVLIVYGWLTRRKKA